MKRLSLGFSPCPNDTFIFHALINRLIKHEYDFEVLIDDVETLNQLAIRHELDITKISLHAWFHVINNYRLLSSGGAFGKGCGPLVVSKSKKALLGGKIALPGELTTASLLFKMAFTGNFDFYQMRFDEIIPAILDSQVDAGVIIHESRFTYHDYGLSCLTDLGTWWENRTGCLIPLGGIIISDRIPIQTQLEIQRLIKESIEYTDLHPETAEHFISQNAQELDQATIHDHINLYVNSYTKDLGEEGKKAVQCLYQHSCSLNLLPAVCLGKEKQLFIGQHN